jgi:hypothetical protein
MTLQRMIFLIMVMLFTVSGLAQTTQQDTLKLLMRKVDILTRELEKQRLGGVAERNYQSKFGMGPAASQVYFRKESGATIAGYGEMVYENFASKKDDATPSGKTDQIDFLRQILYVGYKFNDQFVFNTEIEFEHAFVEGDDDAPGEVAVEFAYIDAMLSPAATIRAGMVLVPVGIINEWHEPPTFYGALRPQTERNVIPSTWRGNGIGLLGSTESGIGYRLFIVEGLNAANFSASGIRSGRQSGGKAIAENFALTGRVEYTAVSGLNIGASFFTGKSGQGLTTASGEKIDAATSVFSAHALFNRSGLELRALYAQSSIDDTELLNQTLGFNGNSAIGKKQAGYYVTGAYNVLKHINPNTSAQILPFVQYEKLNTQKEVADGFSANPKNEITNITFGLMYRPITNIAFKLDYLDNKNEAGTGLNQLNFAVTYLF